jgi:hypothetical protein
MLTRTFVESLARALGPDWTGIVTTTYTGEPREEGDAAWLRRPADGAGLFLDMTQGRGKIVVSGAFTGLQNHRDHHHPKREIGISLSKGPEGIAREIARRLLPGYLAELAEVGARAEQRAQEVAAYMAIARGLAARYEGFTLSGSERDLGWCGGSVTLTCFGPGCTTIRIGLEGDATIKVEVSPATVDSISAVLDAAGLKRKVLQPTEL